MIVRLKDKPTAFAKQATRRDPQALSKPGDTQRQASNHCTEAHACLPTYGPFDSHASESDRKELGQHRSCVLHHVWPPSCRAWRSEQPSIWDVGGLVVLASLSIIPPALGYSGAERYKQSFLDSLNSMITTTEGPVETLARTRQVTV